MEQVQYISNKNSKVTGVIVPVDLWRKIESEAKKRKVRVPLDDVCTQLEI